MPSNRPIQPIRPLPHDIHAVVNGSAISINADKMRILRLGTEMAIESIMTNSIKLSGKNGTVVAISDLDSRIVSAKTHTGNVVLVLARNRKSALELRDEYRSHGLTVTLCGWQLAVAA